METLALKRKWNITDKSPTMAMRDIIEQKNQEDPFYVLDVGELVKKVNLWRHLMPRVKIFYAVKCNDYQVVLETLAALATGFDCASKAEIKKVKDTGVDSSRIIYAHPCKSSSDLRYSRNMSVTRMTFDCPEELQKIKQHYPEAELVIRLRCDAIASTYIFGEKYGASLEESFDLLTLARKLNMKVVGVSFHVGSGCEEPEVYTRAIADAKEIFTKAESIGMDMKVLDIGGGFPGNQDDVFQCFTSVINMALEEHFPESDDTLEIIAEPGRYIVTTAFTLATKIIAKKTVAECDEEKATNMYYVNDGVYGSFSTNLFEKEPFTPEPLTNENTHAGNANEFLCNSIIWGPTCCGLDVLKRDILFPEKQCGEWLYWRDMGAYTLTNSSDFNGFPKPSVHIMVSTSAFEKSVFNGISITRAEEKYVA